ncbi:MAG: hypothetical protein VX798_05605 [Bacteroidota bacterium]|uniref:Uncharacterized protein n=1 Tax=Flagellimonas profundi TaxID=2915620 RepID=A0ABS3FFG4_9FLAO|nr:hypothetical protein [Allomuricauda profundi]MBO0341908.1 hypothetical protein [Allomuricauda profundi]MEC7770639.1 hypothetical protein [Bacteroidota bacterium]
MKRVIFLMTIVFAIGLSSSSLNAATLKIPTDCEGMAFDYADHVYDQTGDGFAAGKAFTVALALCEMM